LVSSGQRSCETLLTAGLVPIDDEGETGYG
jgi:hypothetical protein